MTDDQGFTYFHFGDTNVIPVKLNNKCDQQAFLHRSKHTFNAAESGIGPLTVCHAGLFINPRCRVPREAVICRIAGHKGAVACTFGIGDKRWRSTVH